MRPMSGNRESMADLQRILAGREPLYRRADAEVDTSGKPIPAAVDELLAAVSSLGEANAVTASPKASPARRLFAVTMASLLCYHRMG